MVVGQYVHPCLVPDLQEAPNCASVNHCVVFWYCCILVWSTSGACMLVWWLLWDFRLSILISWYWDTLQRNREFSCWKRNMYLTVSLYRWPFNDQFVSCHFLVPLIYLLMCLNGHINSMTLKYTFYFNLVNNIFTCCIITSCRNPTIKVLSQKSFT